MVIGGRSSFALAAILFAGGLTGLTVLAIAGHVPRTILVPDAVALVGGAAALLGWLRAVRARGRGGRGPRRARRRALAARRGARAHEERVQGEARRRDADGRLAAS